jgi:hypothetical protein
VYVEHYLSAVQLAMEKGYHYRFVQIHTNRMNRITSHDACPFLLWHRRFVLGYENMLRSLAPQYANLTIPYWNYFEDTNRQLATDVACDSLESCSRFLRDMGGGGLTDEPAGENMTIEHLDLDTGTCVSKGIAGHACNHPDGTASGMCRNCILRGEWSKPRKIVEALGPDLLSVLEIFSETKQDDEATQGGAHAVLSHAIETTFHNSLHNTLNATMRYTSSPFDPIFMGHHGTVDLAQLVFNKCKYVASDAVVIDWTTATRSTRFDVFSSCDIEDVGDYNYTAFGNRPMQMDFQGLPVSQDPFMQQFFKGDGITYSDWASAEDLDASNRYTYAIDPYLQRLLESHNVRCPPYLYRENSSPSGRRLREDAESENDARDRETALRLVETLADCGNEITEQHTKIDYRQRIEQEGLIKCLVVEEKSGGEIRDYDDAFRKMMKMAATDSPYCVTLLRRYRSGELALLASDNCLRRYGDQTGVDLLTKRTKQD